MNYNAWTYTFNPEIPVFTRNATERPRVIAKPIVTETVQITHVTELFDQDADVLPALELDAEVFVQAHNAHLIQGQERRDFGHLQGQAS